MKAITRKLLKIGGSNVLAIPVNFAEALDMKAGRTVEVLIEEDQLIIKLGVEKIDEDAELRANRGLV
jgi:antitoxin component of MazEF toxin-antitoxin module